MKRVLIVSFLFIITSFLFASSAFANVRVTVKNDTSQVATDVHVWVYSDSAHNNPVDLTGKTAEVVAPNGWTTPVINGNLITSDDGGDGPGIPPGGSIQIRILGISAGKHYVIRWTNGVNADGSPRYITANDADNVAADGSITVEAAVQRSISISLGSNSVNFGRVRFGETSTADPIRVTVDSNDSWDLYVSAENETVGTKGDIRNILNVKAWNPQPEPPSESSTGVGGLAGDTSIELLSGMNWNVDSFFDVFLELEPTKQNRPGYYKGYVDLVAVQNY